MRLIILLLLSILLPCCSLLEERYTTPSSPVPLFWPQGEAYRVDTQRGLPIRDVGWEEFLKDERLKGIVRLTLEKNKDLKIALLNVERARELYGVRRASLFPEVYASATVTEQKGRDTQYSTSLGISSWEIDLFGRLRSLKDKALEEFFATEYARKSARLSLIASVASAYANLAADKERLSIARLTYETRRKSYETIKRRYETGLSSELDLRTHEALLRSAELEVERYVQRVAQDENLLNLLVGLTVPSDLLPSEITSLPFPEEISPSLSSEILLSRPDILQAEHLLKAAHANIQVARAAFFPRITLTTGVGAASTELSSLFKEGTWAFVPNLLQPIFDASSRRASLKAAKIEREIALAQYEKAIENAFREVADTLAEKGAIEAQLKARLELLETAERAYILAKARYEKGIDNYLSVLEAERTLYAARDGLVALRLAKYLNLVTLYKVLGGGR
jgi:multidrug efflux system outer membrane protein